MLQLPGVPNLPRVPKLLIVKLSSLGDVVHAMPAVQDLRAAYPQAQCDWVVEPGFAPLVRRCEGLHRVLECDLRRWRKQPFAASTRQAWRAFKAELQAQAYDAVLDLQGLSKSALIAWLARTTPNGLRYAMANATTGSSYEAPTRWVADRAIALAPDVHAMVRARRLCAAALHYTPQGPARYGLRSAASHPAVPLGQPVVALVHGTSRADKQWPQTHWVELAQRLHASGYRVALAQGSDAEGATSQAIAAQVQDAIVWPRMAIDSVCDALAACAGVVGVDSGLSHIATALDLPHVQIYNFDTAWRTGPLAEHGASAPRQCSVYASPHPSGDSVWQAWLRVAPSLPTLQP